MPLVDRIARALRVRPMLTLDAGALKFGGVVRSMSGAMHRLVDEVARLAPVEAAAIGHTRRPDGAATLAGLLAERLHLSIETIRRVEAGPALAVHGGPGILAAAVVTASRRR
jgi:fatty acid-binding protein DegV